MRIHVAGIDLIRDEHGTFRVLRTTCAALRGLLRDGEPAHHGQVFPDLFAQHRVRPVGDYAVHLLRALRASVPSVSEPSIVVLTPGVYNSAYFEHALLARQMGVELVEGRDLFCRDNTVLHAHHRRVNARCDVIYRRIDDEFLDPVQFRPTRCSAAPA